jgi:hypothetical protein
VHDAGVVEPNKTVKGRVFTGGAAEGEGKDECNRLELDVPKRSVKRSQSVVGIIATKRIVTSPSSMSCVPLGVGTQTNRNNKCASQQIVSTNRRTYILEGTSDVYESSPDASATSSSSAGSYPSAH